MLTRHGRYDYSPIIERPQFCWPNGARLAVYFSIGVEDYHFGHGLTEDILAGVPQPDMVNTAWRDYGNRVGFFRLAQRLKNLGITPSVLLNTDVCDTAPQVLDYCRDIGAELIGHGRTNSDTLAGLDPEAELAYLQSVHDRIRAHQPNGPKGWSSPWLAHTPATIDLLPRAGFSYLLDLRMDDQPIWLKTASGRLLCIPYAAELNDSSTMIGRQTSARDFAQMIIDEFDELLLASEEQPVVMSVVLHSFISGQPFRLRALVEAFSHIAGHGQKVWLTQPGEIAEYMMQPGGAAYDALADGNVAASTPAGRTANPSSR